MRRHKDWTELAAKILKKKEGARGFVLQGQDEGETLPENIKSLIQCYGIKEFIEDYKLPRAKVYRFLAAPDDYWDVIILVMRKLKLEVRAHDPAAILKAA